MSRTISRYLGMLVIAIPLAGIFATAYLAVVARARVHGHELRFAIQRGTVHLSPEARSVQTVAERWGNKVDHLENALGDILVLRRIDDWGPAASRF